MTQCRRFVRVILCALFLITSLSSYSQLTFSLGGNGVQSKFIEEWQQHKTLEVSCTNGSSDSIPIYFRSTLWLNDTTLMAYCDDSIGHVFPDTLFPGSNSYYLNSILPISSTMLLDSFAVSYPINDELMAGQFKLKVEYMVGDTVFGIDSIEFEIDSLSAPGLEGPYDNCNIYRDNASELPFTWNPVSPLPANSVVYRFKLFAFPETGEEWHQTLMINLDSNSDSDTALFTTNPLWFETSLPDSLDIEYAAANFTEVYTTQVTDVTELYLPSHICEYIYDKYEIGITRYGWTVTALDGESLKEIASNKGMAYPFVFNVTDTPADTTYTVNKNGTFCPNNGFEDATAFGWRFAKGTRIGGGSDNLDVGWIEGIDPGYHTIVGYDEDPIYGTELYTTTGPSNIYALRIGDLVATGQAARASYTFTVGPNTTDISMAIAMALEAHHPARDVNSFCQINVYRKGRARKPYISETYFPDHPTLVNIGSEQRYKPWGCFNIDLSKRTGQTVTLEIISTDCSDHGHYGYTYIDFCTIGNVDAAFKIDKTLFCSEEAISVNGTSSTDETMHEWTVQKCNVSGTPITGTGHSQTFYGTAGVFDIRDFYESRGGTFECNSYYKISLKAWNDCSAPVVYSEVIEMSCPPGGLAGSNWCCPGKVCTPMGIGPGSPPMGYSWSWQPLGTSCSTCLTSTTVPNPTYVPTTSTSTIQDDYELTVTDLTTGCVATDIMTIYFQAPTINPIVFTQVDCGINLSATGTGVHIFEWYYQVDSGPVEFYGYANDITVTLREGSADSTTYFVRATNECGTTAFEQYTIYIQNDLWGEMSDIIYPPIFSPTSPIPINRKFVILDFTKALGAPNSYNVKEWELWILDRNGKLWLVNSGSIAGGTVNNGDIFWDGKLGGKYPKAGEYQWILKYTNCKHTEMKHHLVWHRQTIELCPDKRDFWRLKRFFGGKYCDRWELTDDHLQSVGSVDLEP